MIAIKCDKCGDEILGAYKEVFNANTEGIYKAKAGKSEICMNCWRAFENTVRIPSYPNSEVKT